jgi:hypothetical protein
MKLLTADAELRSGVASSKWPFSFRSGSAATRAAWILSIFDGVDEFG